MASRSDYGPHQLADWLGTFHGTVDRARFFGLLPEPDRPRGRWSATAAEQIRSRWPEIKAACECVGAPTLRRRGWTEAMIRDLLGDPDDTADNPHYKSAPPRRLWRLQRVEAAEATQGFAARKERGLRQRAAAGKAAETRRLWKALGGT